MVVESSVLDRFVRIAHRIVWCSLATVDGKGRPRSRVVHPYWELGDSLTGWMFTRPRSPKVGHVGHHPYVSCSYWDPEHEVAVAECHVRVLDDAAHRQKVWELFESTAPPLGFDPRIMGGDDHLDPRITVLELTPWRVNLADERWLA